MNPSENPALKRLFDIHRGADRGVGPGVGRGWPDPPREDSGEDSGKDSAFPISFDHLKNPSTVLEQLLGNK